MYGSIDREIELPEVVKEKKRQHKPTNLMGMPPFRAFYDDDPLLNNFYSMEILLSTLGIPVYRDANGELQIRYRSGTVTRAMQGPGIFIDEFRSNMEELMMLQPETIESIEWFDHVKTRPDHRTTLYWNPKVETDENGHVSVKFYASDISKRYLVTLEGVSNDGTIVHHQQIIE